MRPLRFLLTLVTCIIAFFFLLFIGPWRAPTQQDIKRRESIGTYFNWRTPSSFFHPSAIISLTDDNSTFFMARPAAFGPLLPIKSLSGALWIGSGFGDVHPGRGGSGAGAEGELGCSDVPGWNDDSYWDGVRASSRRLYAESKLPLSDTLPASGSGSSGSGSSGGSGYSSNARKRSTDLDQDGDSLDTADHPAEDDGTDDYLHHPLPASDGLKTNGDSAGSTKKPTHADIQSLQESAEIAGKIVLLSRGGCGFLEKVKWVQRRGGIALIVGDDIRGGTLVTMYARGDTSNVTIPSLFTSHTTAHLLSSLIPSGLFAGDLTDVERLGFALAEHKDTSSSGSRTSAADGKSPAIEIPNFTSTTTTTVKSTSTSTPRVQPVRKPGSADSAKADGSARTTHSHIGWFWAMFGGNRPSNSHEDSRRPPSSGHIGWVLQEDFEDDIVVRGKTGKSSTSSDDLEGKLSFPGNSDDFVIGVQDWRDPDLVAQQKEQNQLKTASTSTTSTSSAATPKSSPDTLALKGGSITPGSGEYHKSTHQLPNLASTEKATSKSSTKNGQNAVQRQIQSPGWFARIFRAKGESTSHEDESVKHKQATKAGEASVPPQHKAPAFAFHLQPHHSHHGEDHEGLWVTLTPTSSSSSPFFDTLLVLVVSPLVTLTVVYALLLLRSRIRRRRWRAPKSIVERLPVRTYHTMPSASTSTSTSSATSTVSSPITATTPLLPHSATRPINARSRPRARTASDVPHGSSLRSNHTLNPPSLDPIEEKRASGLAEWRRRYGGKQRECVVCLEEYIDGVSRVMSLPCGHEFHAECITPWLTTRRRTCPICKGDVVRSMARSSGSHSRSHPSARPHDDDMAERENLLGEAEETSADAIQEQAATMINDDPASAQPVSREDEAFEDLERGMGVDRNR